MNDWMNWPWKEMLLSSTFLLGILTSILLLTNKYPSSRFLGKFIATNLLLIISLLFHQTYNLVGLGLTIVSVSLFLYSRAFFIQNTRVNARHLSLIVLVAILSLLPEINKFQLVIRILITFVVFVYLYLSITKMRKEGKARGITWFENPGNRLVWFRNFLGFNFLLVLYWLFSFPTLSIEQVTLGTLIQLCFVYFQIFKESAFLSPMSLGNKYEKSTLTAQQKYTILKKLDSKLSNEKFYLENTISLKSLASDLNTTTHHLSQVLNESKGISFQELISQYRIKEAKLLLKDPDHKGAKIENIAEMVGYYSKSAFNTAFKKYTGQTPTGYRASGDVRSYREELLPDRNGPDTHNIFVSSYHVLSSNFKRNMVYSFLKVFYRTLLRNKVFSVINLFGLTVGFTSCILIYLFISDELSYDRSLPNSDRIYRINWINENPQTRTPHPMAQAIARDMPEVEVATSLSPWYGSGMSNQKVRTKNEEKNIIFEESNFYFVDSTFFDVFNIEVLAGDKDALKKPWNLVITDEMASKYFGDENPIGKQLVVNDGPTEIAAVVKGMPRNSHFHFQALISYVTIKAIGPDNPWFGWNDFGHFNYIKTIPEADHNKLETKIPDWVLGYLNLDKSNKKAIKDGSDKFELQPITDIHLNSHLRWELENNGNIQYVYILTGTLIFILLIVGINYVNLTTAKSLERAKEIGIRKTLGAVSGNLTIQFYLESLLFCFFALLLAFFLSVATLEAFNYLTDKSFLIEDILNKGFILKACILCLIISIASGFYPAMTLTSFIPTDVLKGKFSSSSQGNRLRSVLVALQFFVSAILIIGSLIILKQIDFMKSKELGFDQDAIISIKVHNSVKHGGIDTAQVKELQNQFGSIAGVKNTSAISNLPGEQFNQNSIYLERDPDNKVDVSEMYVDFGITDVFDLEIIKGRSFDRSHSEDLKGVSFLLNERAVHHLNLTDPVGKVITWLGDQAVIKGNVIGIVKDFHYKSLHETIQPLIIQVSPWNISNIVVKMEGQNFQQTLSEMEDTYQKFENEIPFEYSFLDQQLAELYGSEVRTLNIFSVFAAIALFLACLGLLGIAMAILNQKIKEVGIRKILGASSQQIIGMVLSRFTRLIVLALIFGLPVGYLLMQRWVSGFSYQVPLGILPFLLSTFILLGVAIASVSAVVLKIAYTNPVESLRHE